MIVFTNNEHLNHHHRDTLETLFAHPISHNLKWVDVRSLLVAAGTVEEKSGGEVRVVLGAEVELFNTQHNKDVTVEQIADLRRMFRHAGFVTEPVPVEATPES